MEKEKIKHFMREWVQPILIALVLALIVRTFFMQAYKIPTGSMKPTLLPGDRILVNKIIYDLRPPQRGDIVVFESPIKPYRDFIKRLVGKGGEILQIENGNIKINNNIIDSPEVFNRMYYYKMGDFISGKNKIKIPKDHYFMLGDNSLRSKDSRFWGFVPQEKIIGKAFLIYWPLTRIRVISHK